MEMHKIALNVRIPSSGKTHHRQRPLGGQGLLYKTYDDYFNKAEDISSLMTPSLLSASSNLLGPLSIQASKNNIPATPGTELDKFFFVLSASSPCDVTPTPISPVKKGDIPDALLHLLPRRSNSLLDVVSTAKLTESSKPVSPRQNSAPSILQTEPASHQPHSASTKTPQKIRPLPPLPILLRDSTAAVPMSQAFTEPSKIPSSSSASVELTSISVSRKQPTSSIDNRVLKPLRRPDSSRMPDPRSKIIHSQCVPIPPFARSALRHRMRKRGRADVVLPPTRVPLKYIGRRNSPFPIPIQSDFAPSSVPGSERTPYGYF